MQMTGADGHRYLLLGEIVSPKCGDVYRAIRIEPNKVFNPNWKQQSGLVARVTYKGMSVYGPLLPLPLAQMTRGNIETAKQRAMDYAKASYSARNLHSKAR